MKMYYIFLSLLLLKSASIWSQKNEKMIIEGNKLFMQQQYAEAANAFNKALSISPGDLTAKYNLATTLYRQGKWDEAATIYTEIAADANKADLRSKAFYNNGVILTKQKKLEESIEAYKNALRQNPGDAEARENLQKALLELKKKTPPPPEKKEEKQKNKKQEQPKKQPQPKMSQKEAEQRLKLLEQKEKEVQQRLQKEKARAGSGQTKDW
jgi:Ca-activated chloride channel family protein